MPIIKSAKKRVRVAKRQSTQNAKTKRSLRQALKDFQTAITSKKNVSEAQQNVESAIDTAVKKGVIAKNKGARKKSQINSTAKAATGGKRTVTKKKPVAKPAAKKTTAKKAPAKKPAAKKSATKSSAKK